MNKLSIAILFVALSTLCSCRKETPQTRIEQSAIKFCEAFYNFNYPVAKDFATPSSLSYLSFLASNVKPSHLLQLKQYEAATISVITSNINSDSRTGIVVCQINNGFILNPFIGELKQVVILQDTLHLIKKDNIWLVRKDIPLQNGKQNHD